MDNTVLRELPRKVLMGPAARFGAVERVMREHGYSERAACTLIGVDRSTFRYECADGGDTELRKRLRELANQRRRFGYRRLAILLRRAGAVVNLKRIWRLYREERLSVRRRGGRRRALGTLGLRRPRISRVMTREDTGSVTEPWTSLS